MPIIATCPRCQATGPIGAYLVDAQVRAAWEALSVRWSRWPGLVARVLPYLDLHAPAEHRVHPPKLVRLLSDLGDLIDSGKAIRDGQSIAVHPGHWALAMDAAQDARSAETLRVPLADGFGWLSAVAAAIATDSTRAASAAALRDGPGSAPAGAQAPTPADQGRDDLRELVNDIQHWERLAVQDPANAAHMMARLVARYQVLTGRPWRGPTQEPCT